jgi:hypothetical protein
METKDTFEFVGEISDMNYDTADDDDGFCPSNRPAATAVCCSAGLV